MKKKKLNDVSGGLTGVDLTPEFSFFYCPGDNAVPAFSWRPFDVYNYIRSDYARLRTELLRCPMDWRNRQRYLNEAFDFVTFAGVFSERAEFALTKASGYVVLHLPEVDVREAKAKIKAQQSLKTVLVFTDVFGTGVVWVVRNVSGMSHQDFWRKAALYCFEVLHLDVEVEDKMLSARCFLPYDRSAYIGPEYIDAGGCFVGDLVSTRSGAARGRR